MQSAAGSRTIWWTKLAVLCAIALPLLQHAQQLDDGPIPREALFGLPGFSKVQVNPDGTTLGYLAGRNGSLNIWIRKIGITEPIAITNVRDGIIEWWQWMPRSNSLTGEQLIYAVRSFDTGQLQLWVTTIGVGADLATDGQVELGITNQLNEPLTPAPPTTARFLKSSPSQPDEILAMVNQRDSRMFDVWRINTRTGEHRVIYENANNTLDFVADENLNIRAITRATRNGGIHADMRDAVDQPWYELARWDSAEATNSKPLGFSTDGRTLFVADSRYSETSHLYALTTDDAGMTSYVPIASDQQGELVEVLYHPQTGLPQAVAFEDQQLEWFLLDNALIEHWQVLRNLGNGQFRITSRDANDLVWIIEVIEDDKPASYYLYNCFRKRATRIYSSRPNLLTYQLRPMQVVEIPSRVGDDLTAFITRADPVRGKLPPMVVLVESDPAARPHWAFDPMHQWLSSRGYTVMSVATHGAHGFGRSFAAAGHQEWARLRQDDLIDAVNWAVERKMCDPDRVALLGEGYGGFAALVGLSFTPEFFATGISINGPTNLRVWIENLPESMHAQLPLIEARVGPLDRDMFLESISPLSRIENVVHPLLLIQNKTRDDSGRVNLYSAIAAAMRRQNVPVSHVVFNDDVPNAKRPKNAIATIAIIERFLAEHLGGMAVPIDQEVFRSSADLRAPTP